MPDSAVCCGLADDKLRWLNLEKRGRAHQLSDEKPLEIRTRIAALEDVGTVPKDISLKLLDTPGPNEAGEESLRCHARAKAAAEQSDCAASLTLLDTLSKQ